MLSMHGPVPGLGSGVSPGEHGGSCSVLLQQESSAHHIQPVSIAAHAFAYQEGFGPGFGPMTWSKGLWCKVASLRRGSLPEL
ncbi:hypothetical protein ABBQ32_003529 [Trebouxia sp. C0010 RCD-2024]